MVEDEKIAVVPFYIHEAVCDKMERSSRSALDKMEASNKRMMACLVVVCLTLIITVCSFLIAYKSMNDTWIGFFDKLRQEELQEEVQNDIILDERDEGADSNSFKG